MVYTCVLPEKNIQTTQQRNCNLFYVKETNKSEIFIFREDLRKDSNLKIRCKWKNYKNFRLMIGLKLCFAINFKQELKISDVHSSQL